MIIWLASYPRSGNTFARLSLYQIFNIQTYSVYNDPLLIDLQADNIVGHKELPKPIEDLKSDKETYIVKTHDLPSDDSPAIYLVRDGRDSIISFARYIYAFETEKKKNIILEAFQKKRLIYQIMKELITEKSRYGGWSENVTAWLNRPNGITHIIRFEDLIKDPANVLAKALNNTGISLYHKEAKQLPSFDELHRNWPDFFRKGKKGNWKREMPEDLHELFWQNHSVAMRELGYNK